MVKCENVKCKNKSKIREKKKRKILNRKWRWHEKKSWRWGSIRRSTSGYDLGSVVQRLSERFGGSGEMLIRWELK